MQRNTHCTAFNITLLTRSKKNLQFSQLHIFNIYINVARIRAHLNLVLVAAICVQQHYFFLSIPPPLYQDNTRRNSIHSQIKKKLYSIFFNFPIAFTDYFIWNIRICLGLFLQPNTFHSYQCNIVRDSKLIKIF